MREGGVEPPRPHGHTDLNRARLPIPPLAHVSYGVSPQATHKTIRTARGAVQLRECDLRYLVVVGPVTWLLRARLERIDRERAEQERGAPASAAVSEVTASDTAASKEGGW